jgi:hypothetical protein
LSTDAKDYVARRAQVHGITLSVLIKKAVAPTPPRRSKTNGAGEEGGRNDKPGRRTPPEV